jgi:SAM-dependent MidA family methyltransferase
MTVARFMELALHHPRVGYYARAPRRSGRAGDFFTSVDVGPLFGELLAHQLAEMAELLRPAGADPQAPVDLVEAGAGNGRLAADILSAIRRDHPALYPRLHLHLVESSEEARRAQPAMLGALGERLSSSGAALPPVFSGILIANELLDAFPVHQVVARTDGLREVYVTIGPNGHSLETVEGAPSSAALADYLARVGVVLEPGMRAEINLGAIDWMRDAARRLRRGFVILIDYGHHASHLYSVRHWLGTLATFRDHRTTEPEPAEHRGPAWLRQPGLQDVTAHVDFTSVRRAAEEEGLVTLAFMDQTYLLLGLLRSVQSLDDGETASRARRALKTLILPGGLGSTHKVLILGRDVGRPALSACSFGQRVT